VDTPQFCSSDMSPQSLSPSQIHRAGIHRPVLAHWNESGPHVGPVANSIQTHILLLRIRVFNRPEFSLRHDFQAKKFGRQCTKSGSHATAILNSMSVARLSSICQSVCHGCIIVINQCEIGPRLLLITYRKLHIGFHIT